MTNSETSILVKRILGAFPAQRLRLSEEDIEHMTLAYVTGLRDLEHGAALRAIERVARTSRFLPTIAEIREAAMDAVHGRRKNGGDAWGECLALIRRYGSHRHPGVDFEIQDPHVAATIRAFGWLDLCRSENAVADRARFIELYDQLAKGDRKETQIAQGLIAPTAPARAVLPSGKILERSDFVDPAEARKLIAGVLTSISEPVTDVDNKNGGHDENG